MKKLVSILLVLTLALSLASCGKTNDAETTTAPANTAYQSVDVSIATLAGPTGVGMVKLMDLQNAGQAANNYKFTLCTSPVDEVIPGVVNGNFQIASVPVNVASLLYNKTNGGVKILAVNTAGVLYIVANGVEIGSLSDLEGKTIYAADQGATPEFIINYLLEKNGLLDKVNVEFLSTSDEVAAKVATESGSIGMLPEPKVTATTMKNADVKVAINLTKEYEATAGISLIQGCVIATKEFCDNNPAAVEKFLEEYKASIDYTSSNLEDTANLCEKYGVIPKAPMAQKAIPNCNITFITGEDMKNIVIDNLKIFLDAKPALIGGKMPADDFYYAK